ncbi:GLUG motif-containing protein [Cohnella cellulosilytica]|uniref:GLUG motif-containing protein n=1 Tax=Cohnella cellulosilytica TaxID=986710 RepID=A0ABW2FI14_9BACL
MNQWIKQGVLVLVICMLVVGPYPGGLAGTVHAAGPFAGGDGTPDDPFQIATAEQLDEIRNYSSSHFVLNEDIDLSTSSASSDWVPIPDFTGSLDGRGHRITNLYIQSTGNDVGLFAKVGTALSNGIVHNLEVHASQVQGIDNVGILAGTNFGSIENVSVTGAVYGQKSTGGLIGFNNQIVNRQHRVFNSHADVYVSGLMNVGGLIGDSSRSDIINSSASGVVTGQGDHIGGLIGQNGSSLTLGSHATSQVQGVNKVGGLVGRSFTSDYSDSSAAGQVQGEDNVGGLIGIIEGTDPRTISQSSATGDVNGNKYVGGLIGYSLNSAITDSSASGDVTGQGDYVGGLIGNFSKSNISDSIATGSVAGEGDYVGGLIGHALESIVSLTSASGSVVSKGGYVGGLIGQSRDGDVSDSFATGDVKANQRYIGGLIGRNRGGDVANSYAAGTVVGDFGPVVGDFGYVGGLIGRSSDGDEVKDSFATGNVTANSDYIGGLIGYAVGNVTDSYATGHVDGERYVGGLIGDFRNGDISDSFAEGMVTGEDYVGGLAGFIMGGNASISSASGDVRGDRSVGGLVGEYITGTITEGAAMGSVTGSRNEGGLVGSFQEGDVSFSYAAGEVKGHKNTGGLIGEFVNSSVTYSYAAGNVAGEVDAGGLVGGNRKGDISFSFATGNVSGCDDIGGLVGDNDQANISNSYATANLTGCNPGSDSIGGLVGDNSGTIENSFAKGSIIGPITRAGGLVGDNRNIEGNITNSYYDLELSGQLDNIGQGLTSEQMKDIANYEGWNFDAVWKVDQHHDGYPYLIGMESMQAFLTYMGNDSNDDSGLYVSKPYKTGSLMTIEDLDWTRTGHLLQGWNTESDGSGVPYGIGDTTQLTSNLLLYANWQPIRSDNANMASLKIVARGEELALSPEFAVEEKSYRAETTSSEATIIATPSDGRATVSLEGDELDGGKTVFLVEGDNGFELVVTAENGETEAYSLTIHRKGVPTTPGNQGSSGSGGSQSNNANLADLNVIIDGEKLVVSPEFAVEGTSYRAETMSSEATIKVTPSDARAAVSLGDERIDGEKTVALEEGDNVFELVVKAEDGTIKTYRLKIYRAAAQEALEPPVCPFSDMTGHWAESFLCEAFERGIVNGHTETRFSPQSGITRVEFAAILLRTLGMASSASALTEHRFVDEDQIPAWATSTVHIAVEKGLLSGYPDHSLRPMHNVSRAEMAAMIARAMKWGNSPGNTTFRDDADIPHWAKGDIQEVAARGLLNGRGNNRFSPLESATRAEAAVLLLRLWHVIDELN